MQSEVLWSARVSIANVCILQMSCKNNYYIEMENDKIISSFQ